MMILQDQSLLNYMNGHLSLIVHFMIMFDKFYPVQIILIFRLIFVLINLYLDLVKIFIVTTKH